MESSIHMICKTPVHTSFCGLKKAILLSTVVTFYKDWKKNGDKFQAKEICRIAAGLKAATLMLFRFDCCSGCYIGLFLNGLSGNVCRFSSGTSLWV